MEENDIVERLILCDEATFHISGKVNGHNVRIWGTEQPHAQIDHQRASPKSTFSVWCPARKCTANFSSLKQI